MLFSLMFFSSNVADVSLNAYGLLLKIASLADSEGFSGIWTPERHFHPFGGLFPNPSITSAALATCTTKVQIRAGSLISPLHNTIRIAEDWTVIDNLSNGRAALSFAPGWNINDFALSPASYGDRKRIMFEQVEMLERLWSGEAVEVPAATGGTVSVKIYPRPVQSRLPIWITSSGNDQTFIEAGRRRYNLLTHLIGQNLQQLERRIGLYRAALSAAGGTAEEGRVSLMVHTFIDKTKEVAIAKARLPLKTYLATALDLGNSAAIAKNSSVVGNKSAHIFNHDSSMKEEMLEIAVDRYLDGQSVVGSEQSVVQSIKDFTRVGVDELACLVDFGLADDDIVMSTMKLAAVQRRLNIRPLMTGLDTGSL